MMVLDMKHTGENLLYLRLRRGLTILQLSKILGITKAPIYKWECGEHIPTVDHLVLLSELYNVSIDDIVARKEV